MRIPEPGAYVDVHDAYQHDDRDTGCTCDGCREHTAEAWRVWEAQQQAEAAELATRREPPTQDEVDALAAILATLPD